MHGVDLTPLIRGQEDDVNAVPTHKISRTAYILEFATTKHVTELPRFTKDGYDRAMQQWGAELQEIEATGNTEISDTLSGGIRDGHKFREAGKVGTFLCNPDWPDDGAGGVWQMEWNYCEKKWKPDECPVRHERSARWAWWDQRNAFNRTQVNSNLRDGATKSSGESKGTSKKVTGTSWQFYRYVSSELERRWTKDHSFDAACEDPFCSSNSELCRRIELEDKELILLEKELKAYHASGDVNEWIPSNAQMVKNQLTNTNGLRISRPEPRLSYHVYRRSSGRYSYDFRFVPIEPLFGSLRHPRFPCLAEDYTKLPEGAPSDQHADLLSADYVAFPKASHRPKTIDSVEQNTKTHRTKSDSGARQNQRSFLFDIGAKSDSGYLFNQYREITDIEFDHVIVWTSSNNGLTESFYKSETSQDTRTKLHPLSHEAANRTDGVREVLQHRVNGTSLRQSSLTLSALKNPLEEICRLVRPDDYVVVKLAIPGSSINDVRATYEARLVESQLVTQILQSNVHTVCARKDSLDGGDRRHSLRDLIDDFFFEHRVFEHPLSGTNVWGLKPDDRWDIDDDREKFLNKHVGYSKAGVGSQRSFFDKESWNQRLCWQESVHLPGKTQDSSTQLYRGRSAKRKCVGSNFVESLDLFRELRSAGIRAHSWI